MNVLGDECLILGMMNVGVKNVGQSHHYHHHDEWHSPPAGESLSALLSTFHGGAEEEVEDDQEDAGQEVDEEHPKPEEYPEIFIVNQKNNSCYCWHDASGKKIFWSLKMHLWDAGNQKHMLDIIRKVSENVWLTE